MLLEINDMMAALLLQNMSGYIVMTLEAVTVEEQV